MYSAGKKVKTPDCLSESEWEYFPLEAVYGCTAYNCLGKTVPEADGVWEEGSLVALGPCKWYQVVKSMSSNRDDWGEVGCRDFY
jgi:hypothetical protein